MATPAIYDLYSKIVLDALSVSKIKPCLCPGLAIAMLLPFHFNTALTTVNIAKVMQLSNPDTRENSFSMATYKVLFHNSLLPSRLFRLFAINPNSIKNHQHVRELLNFGTMPA